MRGREKEGEELSFSWVQASKKYCSMEVPHGYEGQKGAAMREVKRGQKEGNRS